MIRKARAKNWKSLCCRLGCSVHEERLPAEAVAAQRSLEVAPPRSAGAWPTAGRRSRPHSLAVQTLRYQRVDPEQPEQPCPGRRPNMTSQESIGSCSLDVDRSASEPSGSPFAIEFASASTSNPNRTVHPIRSRVATRNSYSHSAALRILVHNTITQIFKYTVDSSSPGNTSLLEDNESIKISQKTERSAGSIRSVTS